MPQEIYIVLALLALLLLYLLYRTKLLSNDVKRVKKDVEQLAIPSVTPNKSGPVAAPAFEAKSLTDDTELVSVIMAAIMAYESENHASPGSVAPMTAHGFRIRRIVRVN